MKNYFIILLLAMIACAGSSSKKKDQFKVELLIYASMSEDEGYKINILDNAFNLSTIRGEKLGAFTLSESQKDSISLFLNKLEATHSTKMDNAYLTLDTWIYSLKVDDDKNFILNSSMLKESNKGQEIKNLQQFIGYLIRISPQELLLRTFS